jgi:hypothetical protein
MENILRRGIHSIETFKKQCKALVISFLIFMDSIESNSSIESK